MSESKESFYVPLIAELRGMLEDERDAIANAANTSALLYQRLSNVNWVGFYFLRGDELILGPFQGRPACVRIASGRGVCGTSVLQRKVIVVPDVHAFPGHIACDAASRSELVVPLINQDDVLGVLDIDSPSPGRFDDEDGMWMERLAAAFLQATDLGSRIE